MADGEYVQNGDVYEWRWVEGKEPKKFGSVKPEFDPTSAPAPEPSAAEVVRPPEPPEEPPKKAATKK